MRGQRVAHFLSAHVYVNKLRLEKITFASFKGRTEMK